MNCHLQKDSISAEFVSGLQPCSHIVRRTQTFLSKQKMRQKLLTLLISLGFFHQFQDLSQKVCRKFLRASFYIGFTSINYDP